MNKYLSTCYVCKPWDGETQEKGPNDWTRGPTGCTGQSIIPGESDFTGSVLGAALPSFEHLLIWLVDGRSREMKKAASFLQRGPSEVMQPRHESIAHLGS